MLIIVLIIITQNSFANEMGRLSYITSVNQKTGCFETREGTLRGEIDNSSLAVLVIAPITENEWVIIYEGLLSGYDNVYCIEHGQNFGRKITFSKPTKVVIEGNTAKFYTYDDNTKTYKETYYKNKSTISRVNSAYRK